MVLNLCAAAPLAAACQVLTVAKLQLRIKNEIIFWLGLPQLYEGMATLGRLRRTFQHQGDAPQLGVELNHLVK